MTDNPIAAALRAAALTMARSECHASLAKAVEAQGFCEPRDGCACAGYSAAAIAAFLRALPFAQYIETPRGPVGTGHWLDWIADAVEKEARHD